MMERWGRLMMIGLAGTLASAAAQTPRDPLSVVEPGRWRVREIGATDSERSMCVADPRVLLQLGHPGATCSRVLLETSKAKLGVRYSCPGAGYGQTSITVEGPHLVRIQTQGIANGQPFAGDYEARRVGRCG